MNTQIIGIAGRMGHGKDTIAKYFNRHPAFKGHCEIRHFADPIKHVANYLMDIPFEDMSTVEGKRQMWDYGLTVREILQKIGTEMFRDQISDNFWVDYMDRKVSQSDKKVVFIPDTRFANEVEWIKSRGGIIIKVVDPGKEPEVKQVRPQLTSLDKIKRFFGISTEEVITEHRSESYIDDICWDIWVSNEEGLNELYWKLEEQVLPYLCDELAEKGFFN